MAKRNAVQEAMADMQTPGVDVTFSAGGQSVRMADPLAICEALCETAEQKDPNTDPWPKDAEGELEEYVRSSVAKEIGDGLIADILRLSHLRRFDIHYLYRNKETWESAGRTIYGQMKRPSGLLKNYSTADYIVLLNYPVWLNMTPMQRVALVYHELRHGDAQGKIVGHDFEGFFDELALFGTDTYRDWNLLAKAVDKGEDVKHQYSLGISLLDTADDEGETSH